jgi:hypothetical protein
VRLLDLLPLLKTLKLPATNLGKEQDLMNVGKSTKSVSQELPYLPLQKHS